MTDLTPGSPPAVSAGAQRRYLTVVFVDLCDSTRLGESLESEWYAELLATLRQLCTEVLGQHGGTISRLQGDGALAVFGLPATAEDDVHRATRAVLALHARVRALVPPDGVGGLALHSGIHAGLVLLDAGDAMRGRFELGGTVPNLAARLCHAAGRDELLVSQEALGPAWRHFQTGSLRLVPVKGRPDPLAAHPVLGLAQGAASLPPPRLLPFVGRVEALQTLEAALAAACRTGVCCKVVLGAPGVGKTRLLQEFLGRLATRPVQVLRGDSLHLHGAEPFQPFLPMLRAWRGTAAQVTATAAGAVRDGVAALARKGPLVLVLDDWQWADEASHQVLVALRGLGTLPVLVLVTARELAPAALALLDATPLQLPPFTDAEALQTVQHRLPDLDPFSAAALQRHAGGNALFLEELCHAIAHGGGAPAVARLHGGTAWLDILVESRLVRLAAEQTALLRTAAVIGVVVPVWLLEALTGCGAAHPLVRGLAALDFIFPGADAQTLRFKHGLTRDVVYDTVGLRARQALHLRIAEALAQHRAAGETDGALALLAHHYGAAGQTAQAARYAELAGDQALAASALDRARVQYRAALQALDRLAPTRERLLHGIRLTQRLGLACVFDASREDLVLFQRAAELAETVADAATQAQALYWLAYLHYALGDSAACVRHGERALALARQVGDAPLEVQLCATLGQALAAAAEYAPALALLEEAAAVKRRHRSGRGTAVGLAYTLTCQAAVRGDRGEFAQAQALFDEALEVVRDSGHEVGASIRGWRAAVLLWQGRWEEARQTAAEAYRIGEQVRSLFSFSMSRAAGGYAQWMLDGSDAALQDIVDATAWLAPREGGLFASLNQGWLADALVRAGRSGPARHHAAQALQRGRRRDLLGGAMAARAVAWSAAQVGDAPRAQRSLARAMQVAVQRDSAHERAVNAWTAARIAWASGATASVRQWLDPAEAAFEAMDMRWHLAQVQALRRLVR